LDQPAGGGISLDHRLADRRCLRERLRDRQRAPLILAIELAADVERREDEANERARHENADHGGKDPIGKLAPASHDLIPQGGSPPTESTPPEREQNAQNPRKCGFVE
jgi:hypothetical protein